MELSNCLASFQIPERESGEAGNFRPTTHVIHLRKGIKWKTCRKQTAESLHLRISFHYHRFYGLAEVLVTQPLPRYRYRMKDMISVTAPDKYTVCLNSRHQYELIMETLHNVGLAQLLENPDASGNGRCQRLASRHRHGPFMLEDYVSNKYVSMVKNTDYWAYDERHPQNKLPYIDKLKYLIIPMRRKQ